MHTKDGTQSSAQDKITIPLQLACISTLLPEIDRTAKESTSLNTKHNLGHGIWLGNYLTLIGIHDGHAASQKTTSTSEILHGNGMDQHTEHQRRPHFE